MSHILLHSKLLQKRKMLGNMSFSAFYIHKQVILYMVNEIFIYNLFSRVAGKRYTVYHVAMTDATLLTIISATTGSSSES